MRRPPRPHRPPGPGMVGPMGPRGIRGPPPMRPLGPPPGLGIPPLPGPGLRPPVPVGPVSSCTNSTDPASMDSRLFVGNLNTLALKKEDIEAIFAKYGLILGISMHKGYCFVQFNHPDEARHAGVSEDGKHYAGQAIDINIVSQPKQRNALKRSAGGRPVKDPPIKKSRPENSGTNQSLQRTLVTLSESGDASKTKMAAENNAVKHALATVHKKAAATDMSVKVENSQPILTDTGGQDPDILICGSCKLLFSSLSSLAQHKQIPCQLQVSAGIKEKSEDETDEPSVLYCAMCDSEFSSAWSLCQHCTDEHELQIYKTELRPEGEEVADNGDQS